MTLFLKFCFNNIEVLDDVLDKFAEDLLQKSATVEAFCKIYKKVNKKFQKALAGCGCFVDFLYEKSTPKNIIHNYKMMVDSGHDFDESFFDLEDIIYGYEEGSSSFSKKLYENAKTLDKYLF